MNKEEIDYEEFKKLIKNKLDNIYSQLDEEGKQFVSYIVSRFNDISYECIAYEKEIIELKEKLLTKMCSDKDVEYKEKIKLQQRIDKALEYIETKSTTYDEHMQKVVKILKGDSNE